MQILQVRGASGNIAIRALLVHWYTMYVLIHFPSQVWTLIFVSVYTCSFISVYVVVLLKFRPICGTEPKSSLNSRGYIREQFELTPSEGMMDVSGFMAAMPRSTLDGGTVTVERVTPPGPFDHRPVQSSRGHEKTRSLA